MVFCSHGPLPESSMPQGCPTIDLDRYIEHKIGLSPSAIEAGSPDRFAIVETEALRDIIVSSEIAGKDVAVIIPERTLHNPECARLVRERCKLCQ